MQKNDARHMAYSITAVKLKRNRSYQSPPEQGNYHRQGDDKGAAFIPHTMRHGLNKLKSDGNAIADEGRPHPPPPGRTAVPRQTPQDDPSATPPIIFLTSATRLNRNKACCSMVAILSWELQLRSKNEQADLSLRMGQMREIFPF